MLIKYYLFNLYLSKEPIAILLEVFTDYLQTDLQLMMPGFSLEVLWHLVQAKVPHWKLPNGAFHLDSYLGSDSQKNK